jgi:formylglycine-generating enzyme required for sulfatase activity
MVDSLDPFPADLWSPETVRLSPGTFLMGSPEGESDRLAVEGPQHLVAIAKAFAVGKFAVTVEQFATFIADSGHPVSATCKQWNGTDWQEQAGSFRSPGFAQTGNHPAVCVSWEDAQAYACWLSARTGHHYRLLTEAEWEYAARSATVTPFWWGTSITPDQANYNAGTIYGPNGRSGDWRQHTVPVDSFKPNPWGLHQMNGNIWEWVEDCWSRGYHHAPTDGSARQAATRCEQRVLRGGSWLNGGRGLRCARRHAAHPQLRRSDVGFRIAKTL